jgi:uncharacterized DUF497 family protein
LEFEWDEHKAGRNLAKHGVSFEAAKGAFRDPFALTEPDDEPTKERWRIIGLAQTGVLFVVFTERSGGAIRIIALK